MIKKTSLLLALALLCTLCGGPAFADVAVKGTLCNTSTKPVEFHFFHHNDIFSGAAPFFTKAVRACSCVPIDTHTDLWHNMPIARINQLIYRDVDSVSGASIKVCVSAKGSFEGYIDAKVSTCAEARKETHYLAAPELTRAQGDLPILETALKAGSSSCTSKDWAGGCTKYSASWSFTDGAPCSGN
jgi:hypothetical protein